jgi:putative ABC transport system substrate-binding protein
MMRDPPVSRRECLALLISAVAIPRNAGAQTARKEAVPTILFVNVSGARGTVLSGFQRGLKRLGYSSENHRLVYVPPDRLSDFAQDVGHGKFDVIFASAPESVRAARAVAQTVPIVALDLETDPVAAGWIDSYARPGRNLTGLFLDQPALAAKWLQGIKETVPTATRIAVLWDPATGTGQRNAVETEARLLTIGLQVFEHRGTDLDRVFAEVASAACHAAVMLSSPQVVRDRARLAELSIKARLPSISMFPQFAQDGGLLAYGVDTFRPPPQRPQTRRSASRSFIPRTRFRA